MEVFPDSGAKAVEDGVERVGVGWVEDSDYPLAVVYELTACDTSPIVRLLHGMGLVGLDVGSFRVHEGTEGGGHPALPRE